MPKFKLICDHSNSFVDEQAITYDFKAEYLPDVLQNIELFLKGAGFIFDGVLDIVPTEEFYGDGAGTDVEFGGAGNIHSQHYFDTERNK